MGRRELRCLWAFGYSFLCSASFLLYSQKLPPFPGYETSKQKHIVHLFATWCQPCMRELPVFDTLRKLYTSQELELTFICMDFKNTRKLGRILSQKKLPGNIYYLAPNEASLSKIGMHWSGTLPTSIYFPENMGAAELLEGVKNTSCYLVKFSEAKPD